MFVSVCIPVYNGEKFLLKCLQSVALQTFRDFEIIVVDDCSTGKDENGWDCKKICKHFSKQTKIKVNYCRNSRNLGCIESRRNAVYESKGQYICCLDCDDTLEPDFLEKMWAKAQETDADIIHCGANVICTSPENQNTPQAKANLQETEKKANLLYEGQLSGQNLFDYTIQSHNLNYFVWGKLIRRDTFITAWEQIPPCYCVWGEDYVIYFFLAYFAKKYAGIKDRLYNYSVDTGISSNLKIQTLAHYEKICSVSSAFSIIFNAINTQAITITPEQQEAVRRQCNTYLLTNIRYLKYFAVPEIRQECFTLLTDYWGPDYVHRIMQAAGETL